MERPTINISELSRLQEQMDRPQALTQDHVQDYATASLVVLRGLTRSDKLRVLRRMRKLLG
jgi:hypothetical protein